MSKKTTPLSVRKVRTVLPIETLVDAWAMGQVEGLGKAAAFFQVHPETIRRAGARIAADAALRAVAERKREELQVEWRPRALRTLFAGLDALEAMFQAAEAEIRKPGAKVDTDLLHRVAGAAHLLNEKIIAVDALSPNVRRNLSASRQGGEASAPRSASSGGAVGAGAGGTAAAPATGTGQEPIRH